MTDEERAHIAGFASLHHQATGLAARCAGFFTKVRRDREQSLRDVGAATGIDHVALHRFEKGHGLLKPEQLSLVLRWMNTPTVTDDTTVSGHDDHTAPDPS